MILFPNVKINIGLFVTGKRADGYHSLQSIFYPVPWKEAIEAVPARDANRQERIKLFVHGLDIPGDPKENIILKTADSLAKVRSIPAFDIHLLKKLPMGAGLGGGSADAAFALRAMDSFLDQPLKDDEAQQILASVGSDCPFFWKNEPMYVTGRGEEMEPIQLDLSGYHLVVINPGIHISTREAYAGVRIDSSPSFDLRSLPQVPIEEWKNDVYNAFEQGIFQEHRAISLLKEELYDAGAIYASMTGSGSTVYGIFNEKPSLKSEWGELQHWVGQL